MSAARLLAIGELSTFAGQAPDRREGGGGRDGLGVELDMQDRGQAAGLRRQEGGSEFCSRLHTGAETAKASRHGGEVRIDQISAAHSAGIFALLMHSDGAKCAVVQNNRNDWQPI